jgi:hypothetical protein
VCVCVCVCVCLCVSVCVCLCDRGYAVKGTAKNEHNVYYMYEKKYQSPEELSAGSWFAHVISFHCLLRCSPRGPKRVSFACILHKQENCMHTQMQTSNPTKFKQTGTFFRKVVCLACSFASFSSDLNCFVCDLTAFSLRSRLFSSFFACINITMSEASGFAMHHRHEERLRCSNPPGLDSNARKYKAEGMNACFDNPC